MRTVRNIALFALAGAALAAGSIAFADDAERGCAGRQAQVQQGREAQHREMHARVERRHAGEEHRFGHRMRHNRPEAQAPAVKEQEKDR
jgi:hypothetical protein